MTSIPAAAEARVAELEAGIREAASRLMSAQDTLADAGEECRTDPCPTCVFGEDVEATRQALRALVGGATPVRDRRTT